MANIKNAYYFNTKNHFGAYITVKVNQVASAAALHL